MAKHDYANVDEVFATLQIPEIQSLEVQLRSAAAEKRSELRLLVGESYRDLLTTADTIVSMKDMTVSLRKQLNGFITACDSRPVMKKLKNLEALPKQYEHAKERVLLHYLAELRSIVVHFLRQNDLIMASRLYAVARLITRTQLKHKIGVSERLNGIRSILMKAINKCTNIETFATSFAILESASPSGCLKYFLSLQIGNLSRSTNLKELVVSSLKVIESTRQFARLGEVFEQVSRKPLLAAIRCMELDVDQLENCLDEETRGYRPYLKSETLPISEVRQQVNNWLTASSAQLCDIAGTILQSESQIEVVIRLGKEIRNELDEASQLVLYDVLAPALESRLSDLLLSSISALKDIRNQSMRTLNRVESHEQLWSSRIPWSRGTLTNFKYITRKTIKGDSNSSAIFERAYIPVLEVIKNNLDTLSKAKQFAEKHSQYVDQIETCYKELCQSLIQEADVSQETHKLISIMRMLLYFRTTIPIRGCSVPESSNLFPKLIQKPSFVPSTDDMSKSFDAGIPSTISPATAKFLIDITASTADLGIDILGMNERLWIRSVITEAVREGCDALEFEPSSTPLRASADKPLLKTSDESSSSQPQPKNDNGDSIHPANGAPASSGTKGDTDGPHASSEQPNGCKNSDDSTIVEPDPANHDQTKSNHDLDDHAANARIQNYFDVAFLHGLLHISERQPFDLKVEASKREAIDAAVQKSIARNQVLYGTIL